MKHAHEKNDRIQDPEGKIGEDEPVFLLRANDIFMPKTLRFWANQVASFGNQNLADDIYKFADEAETWQGENGCKMPN